MLRGILIAVAALIAWASAIGQAGEPCGAYPVGSKASGFALNPATGQLKQYVGTVQAHDTTGKRVKLAGIWFPVAQVWKPIQPATVSSTVGDMTQVMPYGTKLWAVMLRDESPGYAGEVTRGTYGGHRWTDKGRLVLCIWIDDRVAAVPNCDVSGPEYRRIHVEMVARRA